MLPFQTGRIIFEVAQLREVVPSCQLRASLYCEQQSSHANARKSRMRLTLFDNCRASASDSQNRRIPAQWKDLLRCRRCSSYGRRQRRVRPSAPARVSYRTTLILPAAFSSRDITDSDHCVLFLAWHLPSVQTPQHHGAVQNNHLSSRIAQTMRDLTKGN